MALLLEQIGQLPDAGGLAHAVHANHQNNIQLIRLQIQRRLFIAHNLGNFLDQGLPQLLGIFELVPFFPFPQPFHQIHRSIDADVALNQQFFQLIVQIVVDFLACEGVKNFLHKPLSGLGQTVAQC